MFTRPLILKEFSSKRFTRLYLYYDRGVIMITNNFGGQLQNYLRIGVYWSEWWKYGFRFLWDVHDDSSICPPN
jgi:hypothetical protein